MPDTPNPIDPEIADSIRRVAADDAARFDAAHGRRLLDAKLARRSETPDAELRVAHLVPSRGTVFGQSRDPGRRLAWSMTFLAIAAAILVVVWPRQTRTPGGAPTRYATQSGERAEVTLTDGSHLVLAPESRLEVSSDFGAATRTVTLWGQAYVTVAHAGGAPFIVRTGTVETRVLGTAFDVRYYPQDSAVRIAVVTGRVAERNWRGTVHLAAGDVSLVTDSSATVTAGTDVQSSVAWTQGRLNFTDTPVPAMLASLSRWYGYRFELADSTLAKHYVTLSFDVRKLDEAIVILNKTLGVTTTVTGTRVILQPQQRTQRIPAPARRGTADMVPTSTEMGR